MIEGPIRKRENTVSDISFAERDLGRNLSKCHYWRGCDVRLPERLFATAFFAGRRYVEMTFEL